MDSQKVKLFIKEAKSMQGTPFQHQGRLPMVALDCIGLIIIAGVKARVLPDKFDIANYKPCTPDFERKLLKYGVPSEKPRPGAIACMAQKFKKGEKVQAQLIRHVGIVYSRKNEWRVIHSSQSKGVHTTKLDKLQELIKFYLVPSFLL